MVSASYLPHGFRLGPWQVEPPRGAITGPGGETRHLEPKVMEVLVILARAPGALVARDCLLDSVWGGQPGADQLLTHAVSLLRRALDDRRDRPAYIETVPKRVAECRRSEKACRFVDLDQLMADFERDIARWQDENGNA